MSGTIRVKSELGAGTEVTIDIPFRPAEKTDGPDPGTEQIGGAPLAGIRVLIVEDNNINAEVAAELLAFMGAQSERAADGRAAVEMLLASEPGHFAMVFMDIQMPVMDGIEAAGLIRSSDRADLRTLPIVALTANAFTEESRIVRESGMNDCLAKPVDMQMLCRCVRRWCPAASGMKQGKSEVSKD